jgi:predicted nucleotidyltransferase
MGELDKEIVAELKGRLHAEVLPHLRQMILYGSRARGDAADDADLDLVSGLFPEGDGGQESLL